VIDPLALAQALLAKDSITPARGRVFDVLAAALTPIGFDVDRFTIGEAPDIWHLQGISTSYPLARGGRARPGRRKCETACSTGAAQST
jgi:hypothetical protein